MLRKLDWRAWRNFLREPKPSVAFKGPGSRRRGAQISGGIRTSGGKFSEAVGFDAPEAWDGTSVYGSNLIALRLRTISPPAWRRLADHGVVLLGADYLFWNCNSEDGEYEEQRWTNVNYHSSRIVLLSVEPSWHAVAASASLSRIAAP